MEAHADIAALGLVPDVKTYLDAEADKLAKAWLGEYRVPIKGLTEGRQEAYRLIKGMSTEPQDIDLAKPKSCMEATSAHETEGGETPLPTYEYHLLCSDDGTFPAELNAWEIEVLEVETQRQGFIAWYRNPSRSSQDSLGVAYTENDQIKIFRPDFIFFSTQSDGTIAADIVDPHGTQFSDALFFSTQSRAFMAAVSALGRAHRLRLNSSCRRMAFVVRRDLHCGRIDQHSGFFQAGRPGTHLARNVLQRRRPWLVIMSL